MNTLDDLRSTLGGRADALDDTDRYIRPVAVRARIRVARRRRTASVAAAAVLAVAGAALTVDSLHQPDTIEPAGKVLGLDVPGEVSISGFPYDLVRGVELPATKPRLHLDSDDGRAVSLVARDLGSGSATLYADGEPIARVRGEEHLTAPVPTAATRLRVRFDGAPADARAALALYDSTGELAAGVTDSDGSAVFRDTIGGDRLLTGAFSRPGESEVTVHFTGAFSDVSFSEYCSTRERGLWLNVEVDDQGPISGPCRDDTTRDPGTSSSSFEGHTVRARVVRAYLTRGADGPEVSSDATVLGVAVYREAPGARLVLGMRTAQEVEYAGRTWVLDRVEGQPDGGHDAVPVTIDTADGDRLLGLVARGATVGASWTGRLTHGTSSYLGAGRGSASTLGGVLLAGDRYRVTFDSEDGSDFEGALLVYRPE